MRRILIVDDEPIIVQGLLSMLGESELDIDLYGATSGEEALALLAETRMDIVVSDVYMPGMDGFQLLSRIHEDWPECRVIFLSGHSDFDMIYRAVQGEAVSFLLKTEGFDKIIATLRDTIQDLEHFQHHREIQERLSNQQEVTRQMLQREALSALVRGRSRKIYTISLHDKTGSINLKIVADLKENTKRWDEIKKGDTLIVKGTCDYDKYAGDNIVRPYDVIKVERQQRRDTAEESGIPLSFPSQQ